MPTYRVEALEKFVVRTVYTIEAKSAEDAERICKMGKVGYHSHEIVEGDEEWLETVEVEAES